MGQFKFQVTWQGKDVANIRRTFSDGGFLSVYTPNFVVSSWGSSSEETKYGLQAAPKSRPVKTFYAEKPANYAWRRR